MSLALPTRRDEAWRYSDLEAVASVWPVPAPEVIEVAAGETIARVIVQDAATDAVAIRDFQVILREGATATFHVLNTGGQLGRVTIDVTCHAGAHFELGAAMLGGGEQTLEIVTTLNHIEPNSTSDVGHVFSARPPRVAKRRLPGSDLLADVIGFVTI